MCSTNTNRSYAMIELLIHHVTEDFHPPIASKVLRLGHDGRLHLSLAQRTNPHGWPCEKFDLACGTKSSRGHGGSRPRNTWPRGLSRCLFRIKRKEGWAWDANVGSQLKILQRGLIIPTLFFDLLALLAQGPPLHRLWYLV